MDYQTFTSIPTNWRNEYKNNVEVSFDTYPPIMMDDPEEIMFDAAFLHDKYCRKENCCWDKEETMNPEKCWDNGEHLVWLKILSSLHRMGIATCDAFDLAEKVWKKAEEKAKRKEKQNDK